MHTLHSIEYNVHEKTQKKTKWIVESSRKGFPQRKDDLLVSVKQYLEKNERTAISKITILVILLLNRCLYYYNHLIFFL